MRVCHISTVHPPRDPRIYYRMCCALAGRGFSVTLVAPQTSLEHSTVRMSTWNPRIGQARRPQRIGLALRAALAENAEVYHVHDPELIPMALALKVVNPSKAVVYDVHEDYPAMMRTKYWLPRRVRPFVAAGAYFANLIAGLCLDGVVVADSGVQKDFRRVAAHKTIVYHNFPPSYLFDSGPNSDSRKKADLVYIGGMSERSGVFRLLEALDILARRGIRPTVRLAGYTDGELGRAEIRRRVKLRNLSGQVKLHGRIPYAEVPAWIRSGRIGLVTLQALPKFMKNIPSKMFEYWACGLPVIASDLPPIRQFLSNGKNGLLFDPSSAEDLACAIQVFLENPDDAKRMGQLGQKQVHDSWNNELQIDGLIGFYEMISQNR